MELCKSKTGVLISQYRGIPQEFSSISKIFLTFFVFLVVASDFCFSYVSVGFFPLRNYLIAVFLIYSFISNRLRILKSLIIYFFIPVFGCLKDLILFGNTDLYFYVKPWILIAFFSVFTFYILSKEINIEILFKIFVIVSSLNSIIAILQGLNIELAWHLREMIYLGNDPISAQVLSRRRAMGLAYFPISLSYQLLVTIPMAFYLYCKLKRRFYLIAGQVMVLALLFSQVRSALIGLVLSYIICSKVKLIKKTLTVICIFLMFYFFISYTTKFHRILTFDESACGRIYLLLTGLKVFLSNPFLGIGYKYQNYTDIAAQFFPNISLPISLAIGESFVERYTPHNYFLNQLIIFGMLGFTLVLLAIIDIFQKIVFLNKNDKLLSRTFMFIFVSIIINSFFHNGGFFNVVPMLFVIGMIYGSYSKFRGIKRLTSK